MCDLQADVSFFTVWRAMFLQGTVADIGVSAWAVWCCIKEHCDFQSGMSFPSQADIAKQTGLSKRQVQKSLKVLEEHGLIEKDKEWKHNVYQLREKVVVEDKNGAAKAIISWTYLPTALNSVRQEIHNFLMTGDYKDAKIISIEKLELNINIIQGDQINVSVPQADLDAISDPVLRQRMARLLTRKNRA
jgi:DNA-binding transcriptional regulator YhcF (GntR family)